MLCIYVLRSQKGLARYHLVISYHDCFEKVLSSEVYYYCSLVDYAIDVSSLETWKLLWTWLVHDLVENMNASLHIYNNKSKQSLSKFFFITFSLSTELLEDKQRFKLGGVDTSPTYLLFQTLLPLFWTLTCMIWMELTRTDAVFSRTAMVLFLCRIKSSQNRLKINGELFRKI